ncbi:MAG: hypothetical protein RBS72_06335 [Sedimentisphaerales bacterium]|jgi:hypothetical protein|nr:hypothetical protein [Sedimentisphaerales bacterium]HNY77902.1 hypothetical protein [Sedimentisphaerales bacterium]HOC63298.1 hypothetical protein [Sedimentisphaerales bacterium]HOH64172.1 hypothetical protein [Sedimentisphaerales bacterium]HPY51979.1 hypothetical protein [Sedimentisphaerales bacterium]
MEHAEPCKGCSQAHDCARVYERLGHAGGPSVAWKAVIAFVLPVVAFVAALATFDDLLEQAVTERYRTPCAFFMALAFAVGLTVAASFLLRRYGKKR